MSHQRVNNLNLGPLAVIGGGPWLVLDECPAARHNTLYAAVKGGKRGGGHPRCICPRAVWRKLNNYDQRRDEHARWYQKHKAERAERKKERAAKAEVLPTLNKITLVHQTPIPDMRNTPCSTRGGRIIMDRVIDSGRAEHTEAARHVCNGCPLKQQCRDWVLGAEIKPGS